MNKTLSKLYRASSNFIGNASLTVEQQSTLKKRSLCLPLVSDNPWEKGANEADEIELAVLEDMGLATAPAAGAHDHQKYLNTTTQYERQIAYLRELLNHTFLRAVYHISSRQARLEYKEFQEAFLNKNATRAANQVKKFTAQNIIDYILANCVTDNDKSLTHKEQTLLNSPQRANTPELVTVFRPMMTRYRKAFLNWLQSFAPLMTRYRKAYGIANVLQPDEIKKLWKLHFAKQINMNEQQLMLNFKKDHLSNAELGKIAQLTEGIFDVGVMTKLLTKIGASLAYYEPDAMVKSYLYQHSHSLGWDRDKFHFRNPKEKDSRTKGDSKGPKRKPSSDARDSRHKRQKLDTLKIREINAGENRVDKRARTPITLIKIVASMTTSA